MSDIGETASDTASDKKPWHWPEQVGAFLLALTALTLTGPFSTHDLTLLMRLLYWTVSLGAGWLSVIALILLSKRLPILQPWPPLRRVGLAVALSALPITLVVAGIEAVLRPDTGAAPPWLLFLDVSVMCALIGGAMVARVKPRLVPPAPVPARNPFLDRLPPQVGTALISLTMQDHYVEVTTAKGQTLLHMRFADALRELADYPGQQIHRSHWISGHAFTGLTREGGRIVAHLVDGRSLPVSRSHSSDLKRMAPVRPAPKPAIESKPI